MGDRILLWTVVINLGLSIFEFIAGLISGSVALMADALRNTNDAGALLIAYIARKTAKRGANELLTFGYRRAELIGAIFQLTALILVAIYLLYEATRRFFEPESLQGGWIMAGAGIALFVDIVGGRPRTEWSDCPFGTGRAGGRDPVTLPWSRYKWENLPGKVEERKMSRCGTSENEYRTSLKTGRYSDSDGASYKEHSVHKRKQQPGGSSAGRSPSSCKLGSVAGKTGFSLRVANFSAWPRPLIFSVSNATTPSSSNANESKRSAFMLLLHFGIRRANFSPPAA